MTHTSRTFWIVEISCGRPIQTQTRKTILDRLTDGFAFAWYCLRWASARNVGLTVHAVGSLLVSLYYRVYLISIGPCNIHRNSIPVVKRKRVNTCSANLRVAAKLICKYNCGLIQCFYCKVNVITLFVYSTSASHNRHIVRLNQPPSSRHVEAIRDEYCK